MEAELIAWLRAQVPSHPGLRLGIGDDTAVLAPTAGETLITVDLLTDGVDFLAREVDLRRVGRKALAVNLSDIAAMAGTPTSAVVALALPRNGQALETAIRLYEGLLPLAAEFDVAIAGGDTNTYGGPLVVAVTLLGTCGSHGPLRRSGARPGDALVATGRFGGSILGRQFDFVPRVREARQLADQYELHAAVDVSDGLALDLDRLARASNCGAMIELTAVPIDPAAEQLAARDGRSPLAHALADGEDFELLLAVPHDVARQMVAEQPLDVPLTIIGQFLERPGLWSRAADGTKHPLEPSGWLHGDSER